MNFESRRLTSKAAGHNHGGPPTGEWIYDDPALGAGDPYEELGESLRHCRRMGNASMLVVRLRNRHHVPWVRPA